jgi:hypothetical protein
MRWMRCGVSGYWHLRARIAGGCAVCRRRRVGPKTPGRLTEWRGFECGHSSGYRVADFAH